MGAKRETAPVLPLKRLPEIQGSARSGSAGRVAERPLGGAAGASERGGQPPLRIMSKKSRLVLLAFILSSMNSIASISSIG
jgi:hypothetical protein